MSSKLSEATNATMLEFRPSIFPTSVPTLSHVSSLTYPLTRVRARSPMPLSPASPVIIPVGEVVANIAHGKVKTTFQLNSLSENPTSDVSSWTYIPRLRLLTGVDPDEDEQDDEDWDLDLFTLAVRTVDSVEIIRRNTDEKKLRVGNCMSKAVIKDAMRVLQQRGEWEVSVTSFKKQWHLSR